MSQAISIQSEEKLLRELNQLNAFKRVADTRDGKIIIDFVLSKSQLNRDPFEISKNSGSMANVLGAQGVGRALIDVLIQAGVAIDCTIFSTKKSDRITEIRSELNKDIGGTKK